jgi:ABC-type nitrate/sulfonate/bicarbonate transport system permease component
VNRLLQKPKKYSLFGFLVLPIILILVCFLISFFAPEKTRFPTPTKIGQEILNSLVDKNVWLALKNTFSNLAKSLIVSLIGGITFGYLLGYNKKVWSVSQPTIDFFRSIPVTFLIPATALIIGVTSHNIIWFLAMYPCMLIIIFSIRSGISKQEPERLHSFKVISGNNNFITRFFKVTFYETLPDLFAGFRISISYSIVVITVLEYLSLGNGQGIGGLVNNEQTNQNLPRVYALLFIIGTIGFLLNKITETIQARYIHWSSTDNTK